MQFGALILLCALQVVKIPISVIIDELIALLESSGLDSAQSTSLPSQKANFISEAELSFLKQESESSLNLDIGTHVVALHYIKKK